MERFELNNTYGFRDFISVDEQEELLFFINSNLSYFGNNVRRDYYLIPANGIPDYPKVLIEKLRKRIIDLEGIKKHYTDLIYEDSVSVLFKNWYHTYHKDINYGEWTLTRYNIMLSVPEEGGLSLYGGKTNYIEERAIWKCVSGMVNHGVTKVLSDKPRICLCLGFMIKLDDLKEKTNFAEIENLIKIPIEYEYLSSLFKWNPY